MPDTGEMGAGGVGDNARALEVASKLMRAAEFGFGTVNLNGKSFFLRITEAAITL